MTPVRFAQCNIVMQAPKDMSECCDVHAYRDEQYCITAWRPSPEELVKLNLGEPVYLTCWGGGMPPVSLSADDPFVNPKEESEQE